MDFSFLYLCRVRIRSKSKCNFSVFIKKKYFKIVCASCIKYPIDFTSVFGIYLLMPSKASRMLWQMSGNCLTGLLGKVIDSTDYMTKDFSEYSDPTSGQDLQAMRCLPKRIVKFKDV